ncbi:ammonia-dependent NAD(+) synthetase [Salinicoccus jeotgali]|uniref:NH(3)-dependent NAD(+) synthetase n=2 Tax=Salinicoccus jeotgali TaxID=381634 RepID=A0ABP7E4Q4_9STAP
MLQQEIVEKLHAKPQIEPESEAREIIDFIKEYALKHPFIKSFVLGISGGQDSTLLGRLAQMATDELNEEHEGEYAFHALRLPYGKQNDEQDAIDALDFIQPTHRATIDIKPAVDASIASLHEADYELSDFVEGNEKARERMKAQYAVAAATGGVVLGADHAAEAITGFYTKYGDGAADLMPLYGLNKRQGKQIMEYLGAPDHLVNKVPTADLEDDRPMIGDEEALGVTYDAIDDFLEGREVSPADYRTITGWYKRTQHKRDLPYHRYNRPAYDPADTN